MRREPLITGAVQEERPRTLETPREAAGDPTAPAASPTCAPALAYCPALLAGRHSSLRAPGPGGTHRRGSREEHLALGPLPPLPPTHNTAPIDGHSYWQAPVRGLRQAQLLLGHHLHHPVARTACVHARPGGDPPPSPLLADLSNVALPHSAPPDDVRPAFSGVAPQECLGASPQGWQDKGGGKEGREGGRIGVAVCGCGVVHTVWCAQACDSLQSSAPPWGGPKAPRQQSMALERAGAAPGARLDIRLGAAEQALLRRGPAVTRPAARLAPRAMASPNGFAVLKAMRQDRVFTPHVGERACVRARADLAPPFPRTHMRAFLWPGLRSPAEGCTRPSCPMHAAWRLAAM